MLLIVGLCGVALAGVAVMAPFETAVDDVDGEDTVDLGTNPETPDLLEAEDEGPVEETSPVVPAADVAEGPDLKDEVYGQHLGDALGGNLFQSLLFKTHASTGGVGDDTIEGGLGADLIVGNEGDDVLKGAMGSDMVLGDYGDDTLHGGAGTDVLRGGDGDDVARGGWGGDLLTGGEGNDLLKGDGGDDHLFGQLGADTLDGGDGNDFLDGTHAATTSPAWTDEDDADLIFGGEGADTLVLGAADEGTGGAGEDVFAVGEYSGTAVVPVITDFDPEEDELQLIYDGAADGAQEITTVATDSALTVELGGVPVVRLDGITSIDPGLIRLVPVSA